MGYQILVIIDSDTDTDTGNFPKSILILIPHWTVLRRLGFWGQNLTLHAIIAQHIVHIKGNIIIFAIEISKLEKNCLKVGKNQILVCNRGQRSTFSKLVKITTQNSIFSNFEAIFFKFRYLCGKNNYIALDVHNMLSNNRM